MKILKWGLSLLSASILITCSGTSTLDLLDGNFGERNPAVEFDKAATEITEGAHASDIRAKLTERPNSDVTFNLNIANINTYGKTYSACTPFDLTISPAQITFSPENYDTEQVFSVSYPSNNCLHNTLFLGVEFEALQSDDELFNKLKAPVLEVVVLEIEKSVKYDNPVIELIEGGASANLGVNLAGKPDYNVTFNLDVINTNTFEKTYAACTTFDLTITPSQLIFTPENYHIAQNISFNYPDNDCVHKTLFYGIQFSNLQSADVMYANLATPELKIVVIEDAGVDTIPNVIALDPYDKQPDLPADQTFIRVHFNKDMDASTITPSSFIIEETGSSPVKYHGAFAWYDAQRKDAYLSFNNFLLPLVNHTARLSGSIKDIYGNSLNSGQETTYTFESKIWYHNETGRYDTAETAKNVVVIGNYAYVAEAGVSNPGLRIINISNPTAPTLVASHTTEKSAMDVAVSGNYAYLGLATFGIEVVNISNQNCGTPPCALTQELVYIMPDPNESTNGVTIEGNYLYAANGNSGMIVLSLQNPASPSLAASYDTAGYSQDITVNDTYAYVADGGSGLQIIDISNQSCGTPPCTLAHVSSLASTSNVYDVNLDGNYAYLASGNAGFQVADISVPSNPFFIATIDTVNNVSEVDIMGKYAYIVDGVGLKTYDITSPAQPLLVGSHDTEGNAHAIQTIGDYAYIADYDPGLIILDISQLTSPKLTETYNTPGSATNLLIEDNYAFVADLGSGLQVIDISNPKLPVLAASYFETDNFTRSLAISGDYAYVANSWFGLTILDISNHTCDARPCA
ncbi:MAG: Ig-like domain-containing protein, partial [Gammaproteobacteria bacterium]|nr:Ig-like domain-containing protein [Gammaproteobacteria bacterium]